MTKMKLPIELIYKIIHFCLQNELEASQDILEWNKKSTTMELLQVSAVFHNTIIQQTLFHRLRLFKTLQHIPKQDKPIHLAIGISDTIWTILEVDIRNERINASQYESFLVLDEMSSSKKRRLIWEKYHLNIVKQDTCVTMIPYFYSIQFFQDLNTFTTHNIMSIWLWKKLNSFFKKDRLISSHFVPILNTQEKELLAWDRPISKKQGLTESVMLYNTELFGRLL